MSNQKESTEERIKQVKKLIVGAREDIKNNWSGDSKAREDADQQLSAALVFLDQSEDDQSEDDQFVQTMTDARTTIGTFFDDLRDIYEPKECNSKP